MKKFLSIITILLTLLVSNVAYATVPASKDPMYFSKIGNAIVGVFSAMDLGTTLRPFGSIYAGALTISGIVLSGTLAMGNYGITGASTVTGTTALSLSTLSNANLTLLPNGTGITKIGDALSTALSLSDNDDMFVTGGLEVGESLFTGGMTFATNRGDVPVWNFDVTSAAPAGSAQGYPLQVDGQFILYPYAESDGAGSIQNKEVRMIASRNYGTSTITPAAGLIDFIGATSATLKSTSGAITMLSNGATNKEDLKFDLETNANACTITSSTGVTNLTLGAIGLSSTGTVNTTGGKFIMPNGTDLPATCTVGELFLDTNDVACADADVGTGAVCACMQTNVWAQL